MPRSNQDRFTVPDVVTRYWVKLVGCCLLLTGCLMEVDSPSSVENREQPVHTQCGGDTTVPGIDVSVYQGTIDWDALAASGEVEFAYIRVGDGMGTDSQFDRNWPEARRVGVRRGAYQYFRPGRDPLELAEHYLSIINDSGGYSSDDLPPMIDVETTDGQSAAVIRDNVRVWVDTIEAATGMRPIIYTGSYFWDDNVGFDDFSDYHLWTPHYTSAECPLMSDSWEMWTIWQYSSTGRVTGIEGNVDMNRFNGTLESLDEWPQCSQYNPISDCVAPDWWCPPIEDLVAAGLMTQSCEEYGPNDRLTKAQWAELVGASLHIEDTDAYELCQLRFSDVSSDAGYAQVVAALASLDYGDGVVVLEPESGNLFVPDAAITRCDAAHIVAEAWNVPLADDVSLDFSDYPDIPASCVPAVQKLVDNGIISHNAGPFRPHDLATVGETAVIVDAAIDTFGRPTPTADAFSDPSCQSPITCLDECELDEQTCDGVNTVTCVLGDNGCTRWGQPQTCPAGQACEGGVCVVVCDPCPTDTRTCEDDAILVCTNDATGCAVWQTETVCGDGLDCVDGACVDPCQLPGADCQDGVEPDGAVEPVATTTLERFVETPNSLEGGCSVSHGKKRQRLGWVLGMVVGLVVRRRLGFGQN